VKNEIDKTFYCSAGLYRDGDCAECLCGCQTCKVDCENYHRKHPTPEQFKKEYGKEWDGPCYFLVFTNTPKSKDGKEWLVFANRHERIRNPKGIVKDCPCVCACTLFGCPGADWRPE
jgi:hypothetical protein